MKTAALCMEILAIMISSAVIAGFCFLALDLTLFGGVIIFLFFTFLFMLGVKH